jgi:hypothetical protein
MRPGAHGSADPLLSPVGWRRRRRVREFRFEPARCRMAHKRLRGWMPGSAWEWAVLVVSSGAPSGDATAFCPGAGSRAARWRRQFEAGWQPGVEEVRDRADLVAIRREDEDAGGVAGEGAGEGGLMVSSALLAMW